KTERYSSYPVYHSVYETFEIVEKFYDPTFRRLRAVAQVRGGLIFLLADSQVLPLNAKEYADSLRKYAQSIAHLAQTHTEPMETYKVSFGESFPGIYDALFDIENSTDPEKAWQEVKRQIGIAAFTVNAAAVTLTPPA
ncbi:hypothetical protein XENOCAPTIV_014343, partial [Xenoophorus captivus]